MPYVFANVVLICMFNDLDMKKAMKNELDRQGGLNPGAGGSPVAGGPSSGHGIACPSVGPLAKV